MKNLIKIGSGNLEGYSVMGKKYLYVHWKNNLLVFSTLSIWDIEPETIQSNLSIESKRKSDSVLTNGCTLRHEDF